MNTIQGLVVGLLVVLSAGLGCTSKPSESSLATTPLPQPPSAPIAPIPEPQQYDETDPLHVAFQQRGGNLSLHSTYFGAVLVSDIPFYRIDDRGLTADPSLAKGLQLHDYAVVEQLTWDSDTSARLVVSYVARAELFDIYTWQSGQWHLTHGRANFSDEKANLSEVIIVP